MFSEIIQAEENLNELFGSNSMHRPPDDSLLKAAGKWSNAVWNEAQRLGPPPISADQKQAGQRLAGSPVYICGVHRSGTTLVRDLLDDHPELTVLPSEGSFYTNLEKKLEGLSSKEALSFLTGEWLRRLANPINQSPYWLLGRTSAGQSLYVDFARNCMGWWQQVSQIQHRSWPHLAIVLSYASCTGKLHTKHWVDKTPTNEFFLERIWEEAPAAKVIYVLRDPAAILSSRKKLEPGYNCLQVLKQMDKSLNILAGQSRAPDDGFLLVRYEDLCTEPLKTIRQLQSFLQIRPSVSLNIPTVAGMPAHANSSFKETAVAGKILSSAEHAGQKNLTNTDLKLLSAFIGNSAGQFHYPVTKMHPWEAVYWKLWANWQRKILRKKI